MNKPLPTIDSGDTTICDFLKSLETAFGPESKAKEVRMYFYGVTQSGWARIRGYVRAWLTVDPSRKISAYVGTDHALTEPEALTEMTKDKVEMFILTDYCGTYHPKLLVFAERSTLLVLSGSNNLTAAGLSTNVEFATSIRIPMNSAAVAQWETEVSRSSSPLTEDLLKQYKRERDKRQKKLKSADVSWQFTWKRRKKSRGQSVNGNEPKQPITLGAETLVYEIMPKETGTAGSQIQILKEVAIGYFSLPNRVGATVTITLRNQDSDETRQLSMTYNENSTFRLSIHEAAFPARPCFLVFKREALKQFSFVVVSEGDRPTQYADLDKRLGKKRISKRRFKIIS